MATNYIRKQFGNFVADNPPVKLFVKTTVSSDGRFDLLGVNEQIISASHVGSEYAITSSVIAGKPYLFSFGGVFQATASAEVHRFQTIRVVNQKFETSTSGSVFTFNIMSGSTSAAISNPPVSASLVLSFEVD